MIPVRRILTGKCTKRSFAKKYIDRINTSIIESDGNAELLISCPVPI
jgi:hypothetical protein